MTSPITIGAHKYSSYEEMLEDFYKRRWTDGHPIVPPTEKRVKEFLDYAGVDPQTVVGEFPCRNRRVRAQAVAVNAVMAGCKPEYLPILLSGVKGLSHPEYKFNHIACLRSGFPHFIISGPIVKELDINHGTWTWSAGDRATSTISRAFSLILWNLLEQRPDDGIQLGTMGQPGRLANTIAEDPHSPWTTMNVTEGFDKDTSTITCVSLYGDFGYLAVTVMEPEYVLNLMLAHVFREWHHWPRSVCIHTIQVTPQLAQMFVEHGWTKEKVRQYLMDHAGATVAELKRRCQYGLEASDTVSGKKSATDVLKVQPGDESKFLYLFKDLGASVAGEYWKGEYRKDVMLVVNGADTGNGFSWRVHHHVYNPQTVPIERPWK